MITLDDYMTTWRIIPLEKRDAYMNAALDEVAVNSAITEEKPVLRFYQWKPNSVSLGFSQTINDLDLQKCEFYEFDIVRRETGGKATVHTVGTDICYTLAIPPSMFSNRLDITNLYGLYCGKIADALKEIGLKDVKVNKNDIFTENKKISGNASRPTIQSYMQHGFLFYQQPDIQLMIKLINKSAVKNWKKLRSEEEIASISDNLEISREEVTKIVLEKITSNNYEVSSWTKDELKKAEDLIRDKYKTKKWMEKGTQHKGLCYIIWD